MSRSNGRKPSPNGHRPPAETLPPEAFDAEPRVALTLTDEAVYLTRYDHGRPSATYPVAAAAVASAWSAFGADTGLLPENCLFWQARSGKTRIGVWLPPARRAITLAAGKRAYRLKVPLPGFVFAGEGARYSIWAALERPASPRAALYHAPFPNVYADGGICAGTVAFPRCAPGAIHAAAGLFFESEFNHDLGQGRVLGDQPLLTFLRGLDRKRAFPLARLAPAGITLRDVLAGETRAARLAENEVEEEPDPEWVDEDEVRFDADVWGNAEPEFAGVEE